MFAPQASAETFLAVLLKLYGVVIEHHLHIKDWKQAWVIFTAAGRIVSSQLSNHFNVEMYDANLMYDANWMRSGFLNAADSDISCKISHGGLLCTSENLTHTPAALLQEFKADKYFLHPFIRIRCCLSVFAYSSAV